MRGVVLDRIRGEPGGTVHVGPRRGGGWFGRGPCLDRRCMLGCRRNEILVRIVLIDADRVGQRAA